jgi:hypothetical protein
MADVFHPLPKLLADRGSGDTVYSPALATPAEGDGETYE